MQFGNMGENLCDLGTGIVAEIGVVLLVVNIWAHVLFQPINLFAGHPLAMSVGLVILIQSILSLQPTVTPDQKRTGQLFHATLNFLAFAALVAGVVIIEVNKVRGNGPHFHSLHAVFGVMTLLLMVLQYIVGFTALFTPRLYGGVDRAKSLYKYHRYSGYLILFLLLVTVVQATATPYVRMALGIGFWGVFGASLVILVGVFARIQKQKLGLGTHRSHIVTGPGASA